MADSVVGTAVVGDTNVGNLSSGTTALSIADSSVASATTSTTTDSATISSQNSTVSSLSSTSDTTVTVESLVSQATASPGLAGTGQSGVSEAGTTNVAGSDLEATAGTTVTASLGPEQAIVSGPVSVQPSANTTTTAGTAVSDGILGTAQLGTTQHGTVPGPVESSAQSVQSGADTTVISGGKPIIEVQSSPSIATSTATPTSTVTPTESNTSAETASPNIGATAGFVETTIASPEQAFSPSRDVSPTVPVTTASGAGTTAIASTTTTGTGDLETAHAASISTSGGVSRVGTAFIEISTTTVAQSNGSPSAVSDVPSTVSVATPGIGSAKSAGGAGIITESGGATSMGSVSTGGIADASPMTAGAVLSIGTVHREAIGGVDPTRVNAYASIVSGDVFRTITASVSPTPSITSGSVPTTSTVQQASGDTIGAIVSPSGSVGSRGVTSVSVPTPATTSTISSGTGTSTLITGVPVDVTGTAHSPFPTTTSRSGTVTPTVGTISTGFAGTSVLVSGSVEGALGFGLVPDLGISISIDPMDAIASPTGSTSIASSTDGMKTTVTTVPQLSPAISHGISGQETSITADQISASAFQEGISGSTTSATVTGTLDSVITSSSGGAPTMAITGTFSPTTDITIVGITESAVGTDSSAVTDTMTTAGAPVSGALISPIVVQPRMDRTIIVAPVRGRSIPAQSITETDTVASGVDVDGIGIGISSIGRADSIGGTTVEGIGSTRIPMTDTTGTAVVDTTTGIVTVLVPRTDIVVIVGPSSAVARPEIPTTRLVTTVGPGTATGNGLDVDALAGADPDISATSVLFTPFQAFEDVDVRTQRVPLTGPTPPTIVDNNVSVPSTGTNDIDVLVDTTSTTTQTIDRTVSILSSSSNRVEILNE